VQTVSVIPYNHSSGLSDCLPGITKKHSGRFDSMEKVSILFLHHVPFPPFDTISTRDQVPVKSQQPKANFPMSHKLMERLLLFIVLLICSFITVAQRQPVSVDDLLTLSSLSPKNVDHYLDKKGFLPSVQTIRDNSPAITFVEKKSLKESDSLFPGRRVEMYKKDNTYYFALHTSSKEEFVEGRYQLKKAGFFYDNTNKGIEGPASLCFKKGAITVVADSSVQDQSVVYSFLLQKTEFPDPGQVRFAEDLLKFDSQEHLVHFFGKNNVAEDVYQFSESEKKKCSVLFPNSSQQAVFIWDDESNLHKISFIIIGGVVTTTSAAQYNGSIGQNAWVLKNGIYSGMRLKDLIKANGNDFKFYGRESEFSFMVEPQNTRYIDFKRIGVMLDCFDCTASILMNNEKVSAQEAADLDLAIYVSCIMIRPK
jgi:hypothetical protein